MYNRILVPTDGSPVAELAGEYATGLATRFDAELHVVHVDEDDQLLVGVDDESTEANEAIDPIADVATDRGIDVRTAVLGPVKQVHRELLTYVDEHDLDVIVMGTHGRRGLGRFLMGSVAEQTLRESPVPVVTVNQSTEVEFDPSRVLVATDGSTSAVAAVDHAIDLALETDATLHAIHVNDQTSVGEGVHTIDLTDPDETVDDTVIDSVVERAREAGLETIDVSVPRGRPHQTILAFAAEYDVDAIVMGTHGKTGIRRYLLGSTTERIVRFANVPTMVLKASRGETVTVEYLDYATVDERGWSIEDDDLFERAEAADLDSSVHGSIDVGPDEYILDAAESAGHDWPFYCRSGGCVNCAVILIEGEVEMDVQRSLSKEEVEEQNLRLTCVATPASDSIRLVYNAKYLDSLRKRVM